MAACVGLPSLPGRRGARRWRCRCAAGHQRHDRRRWIHRAAPRRFPCVGTFSPPVPPFPGGLLFGSVTRACVRGPCWAGAPRFARSIQISDQIFQHTGRTELFRLCGKSRADFSAHTFEGSLLWKRDSGTYTSRPRCGCEQVLQITAECWRKIEELRGLKEQNE